MIIFHRGDPMFFAEFPDFGPQNELKFCCVTRGGGLLLGIALILIDLFDRATTHVGVISAQR